MRPVLDSTSSTTAGGGSSTLSWSHTLGSLGSNGLIIVVGIGEETGSDQNPEEVSGITFNGVAMTRINDEANINQHGSSMYELHGSSVPVAGTYTVTVTYKGSGTPDTRLGMCASFRNVYNQAVEASDRSTGDPGSSPRTVSVTTISRNALVVSYWSQRTINSYSLNTGQTEAVAVNQGSTGRGSLYYEVVTTQGVSTLSISPSNPESNSMVIAAFKPATSPNFLAFL